MTQTDPAADLAGPEHRYIVASLNKRRSYHFDLRPDATARSRIAAELGVLELRKLRFHGTLRPLGRQDWEVIASLGATIVQACAITLDPVTTRIDEAVERRFVTDLPQPEGPEIEMPDDDTIEALGSVIDIGALALEALSLATPLVVRKADIEFGDAGRMASGSDGQDLPVDDRPKPFAALAALRDKLDDGSTKD